MKNKKEEIKGIKLSNEELVIAIKCLSNSMLHGQELRSRNRIMSILNDRFNEYESERMDLVNKYGKKDKKGKLELVNNRYSLDNTVKFNKEFNELAKSYIILDILPLISPS